jgi:alkanesulfonate monooxygenase SsuD/methylene tetrahydromethanopterin reductase-like flavin-dependent oxidoreductase (luciferase family)
LKLGLLVVPATTTPAIVERAQVLGFDSAWFIDSPMVFGDVWTSMALAGARTDRIDLATGVTNPVTRSAAVVAATLASLNALAPGRLILGIGTGYSATGAFDLAPASNATLRRFVGDVRALLSGAVAEVGVYGDLRRQTGFINPRLPFVRLDESVRVCVAAAGPRTLAAAATYADEILLGGIASAEIVATCVALARSARSRAGLDPNSLSFTVTPSTYLTDRDVDFADAGDFEALREALGPKSLSPAGNFAAIAATAPGLDPAVADAFANARGAYDPVLDGDPTTAHLRRYAGYMTELNDRQRILVTPALLRATTICGSPSQCRAQLLELEAAGATRVVLSPLPQHASSVLEAFGAEILPTL